MRFNRKLKFVLMRSAFCRGVVSLAGEEWGENEKDWVEKVGEKKMAAVLSYDVMMGAGRLFVFFFPVKVIWLII